MRRLLFLLILPLATLYSSESEENVFANLGNLPSGIVNESVNVISGDYVEVVQDLLLPGIDKLGFSRNFCLNNSKDKCETIPGWPNNHWGRIGGKGIQKPKKKVDDRDRTIYSGPHGMVLLMDGDASRSRKELSYFTIPSSTFKSGMTNIGNGGVSGKTNYRNLLMKHHVNQEKFNITDGSGESRWFNHKVQKVLKDVIYFEHYQLERIEHPNYHQTLYTYNEKRQISKIVSKNRGGAPLSILEIAYPNSQTVELKANNGQTVTYKLKKHKPHLPIEVVNSTAPKISYSYYPEKGKVNDNKVHMKMRPLNRFLETVYYDKGTNDVGDKEVKIKHDYDYSLGKVAFQRAPVGTSRSGVITHRYFYRELRDYQGETHVYDALDRLTTYHYAFNKLHKIVHHNGRGKLAEPYLLEKFLWPDVNAKDAGNLFGHLICTDDHTTLISKNFFYDQRGNPLNELLYGDLTGYNKVPIEVRGHWVATNGVEFYEKFYTYSDDRYNNMLSEEDFRKKIRYAYYPESSLLKEQFTYDNGRIAMRSFYIYDANSALVKVVVDDGIGEDYGDLSGVTERRITEYTNHSRPLPGLPAAIKEKYLNLETGEEEILTMKELSYTAEGWVKEVVEYDSKGEVISREEKQYDRRGNVVAAVDPAGYITTFLYDENNNMTEVRGPHPERHMVMDYDYSDRLVKKRMKGRGGEELVESYSYDYLGNKLSETDCYGNSVSYEYDDQNRVTAMRRGDGSKAYRNRYNKLNHLIAKVDGNGGEFTATYNIRSQPVHLYYPDGSSEHKRYSLDGHIDEEVSKEGIATKYERDFLGRVTRKSRYTKEGAFIDEWRYRYSAFHLIEEVDAQGKVKSYRYDAAGRLIEENDGGRVKRYENDGRGRQVKIIDIAGEGRQVVTCLSYDALDRVVKEVVADGEGVVQSDVEYEYDCDGNKVAVTEWGEKGAATSYKEYNAYGEVVKEVDALGNRTTTSYRYDYIDGEGHRVAYSERVDPLGLKSIVIKDRCGRDRLLIKEDAFGKVLHKSLLSYDNNDNKIESVEVIYSGGKEERSVVSRWEYDASNRLVRKVEAAGTPLQKEMAIEYNLSGQKSRLIKPDGVAISYEYDEEGLLKELKSSDGSVSYRYHYDAMGNAILVEDLVNGLETERQYSPHGELLYEKLGNGESVAASYDGLGRLQALTHPDGLAIEYEYQGKNLKKVVARGGVGSEGAVEEKWSCCYQEYDLRGRVLQVKLPGNCGSARYEYDLLGRVENIITDHWRENIAAFDEVGNIIRRTVDDPFGRREASYSYDSLYQLTEERGSIEKSYQTDSLRNRVAKDGVENAVNSLNQLTHDGVRGYEYDKNGNIVKITGGGEEIALRYDAFDRLVEFRRGGEATCYRYDHDHRRISKGGESYLYHGRNEVGKVGAGGEIEERRILALGIEAEIGAAVAVELGGAWYVPIHDHNGNVEALVDAKSGEVAESYRHSAFGEEVERRGEGINPWRFSSKRGDEESGFVYFGRRYYLPEVGRWTSADPIGEYDGPNLYAYVGNNPLTSIDAYGLKRQQRCRGRWDFIQEDDGSTTAIPLCEHASPNKVLNFRMASADNGGDPILDYASRFKYLGVARVGSRPLLPGVGHGYQCGVNCSALECMSTAQEASSAADGCYTYAIFHKRQGVLYDAIIAIHEWFNISMPPVRELRGFFDNYVKELKKESADPRLYYHCHSRAGMETNLAARPLPKETRQNMNVASYGSASILPKDLFGITNNYVNNNDPVPRISPIGFMTRQDDITYTGFKDGGFTNILGNHGMGSKGYKDAMEKWISKFKTDEVWKR